MWHPPPFAKNILTCTNVYTNDVIIITSNIKPKTFKQGEMKVCTFCKLPDKVVTISMTNFLL